MRLVSPSQSTGGPGRQSESKWDPVRPPPPLPTFSPTSVGLIGICIYACACVVTDDPVSLLPPSLDKIQICHTPTSRYLIVSCHTFCSIPFRAVDVRNKQTLQIHCVTLSFPSAKLTTCCAKVLCDQAFQLCIREGGRFCCVAPSLCCLGS